MKKLYNRQKIVSKIVAALCLALILSSYADANITLNSPNIKVVLMPSRGWTIYTLSWNNRYFIDSSGSGQGTAFLINGVWAGTVHGNETVLETRLSVDGNSAAVVDGLQYTGNELVFYRRTLLYNAYLLTSVMTISENSITEDVSLQGVDANKMVEKAYGVQGSRANRLTSYFGYDANGVLRTSGQTNSDNDSMSYIYLPSVAVCQYDPLTGDAILSTITVGTGFGMEHFIWDRSFDNKLYARFRQIESNCGFTKNFVLQQHLNFFNTPIGDLHEKAADIIKVLYCPQIDGDINDDCEVNMEDFALLAANWLMQD